MNNTNNGDLKVHVVVDTFLVMQAGGDKFLVLFKRKTEKEEDLYPNCWNGISGHVKPYETPYNAAVREIEEEAPVINIENAENLKMIGRDLIVVHNGNKFIFDKVFELEIDNSSYHELKTAAENGKLPEHVDVVKVSLSELPKLLNKITPPEQVVLKSCYRFTNTQPVRMTKTRIV